MSITRYDPKALSSRSEYIIRLSVAGLHRDNGLVDFQVFLNRLQNLSGTLTRLDRLVSGGERANHFRIVNLSSSSPVVVEIETLRNPHAPDTRRTLVDKFKSSVKQIQDGVIPDDLDYDLLNSFKNLVGPIGDEYETLTLGTNDDDYNVDLRFVKHIELEIAAEDQCAGTVEGDLDQINVHKGINIFYIYPPVGPVRVKCHFPKSLLEDAKAAIGFQVAVSGLMKYRAKSDFPAEINADSIEVYPTEDKLPTMDDLRGIAPDATQGLPSEEFVRNLRDGWS